MHRHSRLNPGPVPQGRVPRLLLWLPLLALLAWAGAPSAAAQQAEGTIRGRVIDAATLEPLAGAQVFLTGSDLAGRRLGTLTGSDGRYTLEGVPAGPVTVRVQMIGFSNPERELTVPAGETVVADFTLRQSAIQLDEVVVTGAGVATEKRKLGNTIATIKSNTLEEAPIASVSEILQGREPGVVGIPGSGLTGEGAQIRIRGSASLSQSNEPIIYVDGVRIDNAGGFASGVTAGGGGSPSRLDDINPEAIERVEILKGAAAATLYGTEASNGVIQIFTKKGMAGAPKWTFEVDQGFLDAPEERYKINAGFARNADQAARMSEFFGRSISPFEVVEAPFIHELFETGYTASYSGSVSGGSEAVTYYLSGRYQNEDGILGLEDLGPVGDELSRKQGTLTVNLLPTDKLSLRVTSLYSENDVTVPNTNNNIYGVSSLAMFGKPELVFCNEAVVAPLTCSAEGGNTFGNAAFATVREAMQVPVNDEAQHFNGSMSANYQLLPSVALDATFGVDFVSQRSFEFAPFGWDVDEFTTNQVQGFRDLGERNHREITLDTKGLWNTDFTDQISSSFVLGGQLFISETNTAGGYARNFPGPGLEVVSAASNKEVIYEQFLSVVNAGVFVQEQLGFRDYAFLTLGARYDANSAFGENFDGVLYPKISLSVVPSDMPMWRESDWISALRLRAAVGQSGQQPGAFDRLTTFAPLATTQGPGLQPLNLGNEDLEPEVATEWEIGGEAGLLGDRLALDLTYWDRTVESALVPRQFPVSGGFIANQLDNIGEIQANGWEIGLNATTYQSANLSVDLFANAAYLSEEVTDLGDAPPLKVGGSYPRYRNFIREGFAPGALFGAKLMPVGPGQVPYDTNRDGVPDTEAELAAFLSGPIDPGTLARNFLLLVDEDGDGDFLDNYLGKPTPDWSGAFGGEVRFLRSFRLYSLFEYKHGNFQVTNLTDAFRQSNPVIGRNFREAAEVESTMLNPASTPQDRVRAAQIWATELMALAPFSGLNTIEDGDMVRWRELSLSYQIPRNWLDRAPANLGSAALTLTGRNIALWTDYSGIDPELNVYGRGGSSQFNTNFGQSIDAFGFALPARYALSLRVTF